MKALGWDGIGQDRMEWLGMGRIPCSDGCIGMCIHVHWLEGAINLQSHLFFSRCMTSLFCFDRKAIRLAIAPCFK